MFTLAQIRAQHAQAEETHVRAALVIASGSQQEAADLLGLSPTGLSNYLSRRPRLRDFARGLRKKHVA